jgi:opacity protein-like surface antigen
MKKKFGWIVMIALVCSLSFPGVLRAQFEDDADLDTGKQKSLFAGIGFAFADYEGPILDFGLEMQFAPRFFAQISLDYYLNPLPDEEDIYDVQYTLLGTNIYGVFKFVMTDKFNMFMKAGLHMTGIKVKGEIVGIPITSSQTKFGAGAGIGMEFMLSEKWGLLFGGTYKILFTKEPAKWFKAYGGVIYRI